eukprot:CAMPEP_0196726260 /NCGR_PEP_ID=MMETSP1091-20130531/7582_1 /TAXON_ID=302021 /ORGANISM="Rhodomonas sp., Strain CCMP768" /LENGTH=356 /DNA_ID=CAMNT_0042068661 /DNA_START=29 /DNA_END=1096 /DNA_ORIENTATION=-
MALAGAPVLLKQGYLQSKNMWGWKREYYRLLQDSLFKFATHDSKIPLDEITLTDGSVEDASWEMKAANMLRVKSAEGKISHFVCENSNEHRQWFDALYYATTLSRLAEYCSPLSGGWLKLKEGNIFVKRWFVIKDSFLLCYHTREDMNKLRAGGKTKRKFVLPLVGAVLAYYKSPEPFSFAIQLRQHGEMSGEFVLAASSQTVMNVWMEVLYVSMGNELPQFKEETDHVAVPLQTQLNGLGAGETPMPSKSHRAQTIGKGVEHKHDGADSENFDHLHERWENHPGKANEPKAKDDLDEGNPGNGYGPAGEEEEEEEEEEEQEQQQQQPEQEQSGAHDGVGWNPLTGLGSFPWFSAK